MNAFMTCTHLIIMAVYVCIASPCILKGRVIENRRTHAIETLLVLAADTRSSITASRIVEVYLGYIVIAGIARTAVIVESSTVFVESTDLV